MSDLDDLISERDEWQDRAGSAEAKLTAAGIPTGYENEPQPEPGPAPTQYHLNWVRLERHSSAVTAASLANLLGITEAELAALPLRDVAYAGDGLADALAELDGVHNCSTFEYLTREDIDVEVCPGPPTCHPLADADRLTQTG